VGVQNWKETEKKRKGKNFSQIFEIFIGHLLICVCHLKLRLLAINLVEIDAFRLEES